MSDALSLPPRPNLEQYRKLATDLVRACRSSDPDAVREWATTWVERLARLRGAARVADDDRHELEADVARVLRQWRRLELDRARFALANAQLFIARCHGFESWPRFTRHLDELKRGDSSVSTFEAAVDAIVGGDAEALRRLLAAHPGLARARSTRAHRSTLLHYVSANGVEDFRQRSPKNIVEIARLLLAAGADVNAESEAYDGGATTLGLVATSYPPERARVQIPLLQLLIEHDARVDPPGASSAIRACLANGRREAAEFLANRGARIGLEEAAGVGRLAIVEGCFDADGALRAPATAEELRDGFTWACEYGRTAVVEFLLRHGMQADATLPRPHGQTGLHWAAWGGHADTAAVLLRLGATVHARDDSFASTPLEWALYAWGNAESLRGDDGYYEVVRLLVQAGATFYPGWAGEDRERNRSLERIRSDPRMLAALGAPEI